MRVAAFVLGCAVATAAAAAGGHDALGCAGCHATHAGRGEVLAAVPPNVKMPEAHSGKPHGALTALCLACHADVADGGQGILPVSQHMRHPFSVAAPSAKIAQVPPDLLRDGRFECVSCHDPHPSNPNYRYLRIPATATPTVTELCSVCHARKADPRAVPPRLFSSMDERAARPAAR